MLSTVISIYKPKIEFIKKINGYIQLFEKIVLVINQDMDNNIDYTKHFIKHRKIVILKNSKNYGVAKAMNQGLKILKSEKNTKWVCLLDQDSSFLINPSIILKNFLIEKKDNLIFFAKYQEQTEIGSSFAYIDKKSHFTKVNYGIISGMFISKSIYSKFYFDEDLFIDLCDRHFCKILKNNNIAMYSTSYPCLKHEFGNTYVMNLLLLRIKIYDYSPIRLFLMSRNRMLLARKYKKNKYIFLINLLVKNLKQSFKVLLFENNKIQKIKAKFIGIYFGFFDIKLDSIDDIKDILK
jgi:rhamnosyltransferase